MITPTLERESALWAEGYKIVVGVDEVGRGPLAGPVVVAAVAFPPGQHLIDGLRDSKLMTAAGRERIANDIRDQALAWSLSASSTRKIDRVNIRMATILAMRRALSRLPTAPDYVLIDGTPIPELERPHEAIVAGDKHCLSIAAAAVLAKCARDRLMSLLAKRYPEFGWDENKGYATRAHLDALDRDGPTPHHRTSFTPVVQLKLF